MEHGVRMIGKNDPFPIFNIFFSYVKLPEGTLIWEFARMRGFKVNAGIILPME